MNRPSSSLANQRKSCPMLKSPRSTLESRSACLDRKSWNPIIKAPFTPGCPGTAAESLQLRPRSQNAPQWQNAGSDDTILNGSQNAVQFCHNLSHHAKLVAQKGGGASFGRQASHDAIAGRLIAPKSQQNQTTF